MIKIYPKTSEIEQGVISLKTYAEKYKGIEIQYFHNEDIWGNFNLTEGIEKILKKIHGLEEITVHPPLHNYDIEVLMTKDENMVIRLLDELKEVSGKYNLKLNIIFHTHWNIQMHEQATIEKFKKYANYLENTNIKILIENLFMTNEDKCAALEICERVGSNHLKTCIDVCHLYCKANIKEIEIEKFLEGYLDKELCKKHVYQVHFADTKNNDGYKDKKTHGRKHDSYEDVVRDFEMLKKYGIEDVIFVTEVGEEDYETRKDQIEEIEYLERI